MISSFFSLIRDKIRVHFDRYDFIVFIVIVIDVSKIIINKLKKLYLKTDDVIVFHFLERSSALNEYYVK